MNDHPRITAVLGTYRKGEMVKLLKDAAALLGARTIGVLFAGLACVQQKQPLSQRTLMQARRLGQKLVQP